MVLPFPFAVASWLTVNPSESKETKTPVSFASAPLVLGNNVKDRFNLYEKVPLNKKSTSYDEALTGNMQANAVSRAFFSVENILVFLRLRTYFANQ